MLPRRERYALSICSGVTRALHMQPGTLTIMLGHAQLYDAAIVANGSHAAAWHGWGLLEKRQGNPLRARDLWVKAWPASCGAAGIIICFCCSGSACLC